MFKEFIMIQVIIKGVLVLAVIASALNALEVGDPAPQFSMYQYKDITFNTDTVYGKKVVGFIFGSIT